jgi:DNA-binding beta-propeller fold protein YncE
VSGGYAYVGNDPQNSGGITVIRTSDNTIVDSPSLTGFRARGIAFSPDGSYAYAVGGDTVTVIRTSDNTVTDTLTGFSTPNAVAVSNTDVYVVNQGSNSVSVISTGG